MSELEEGHSRGFDGTVYVEQHDRHVAETSDGMLQASSPLDGVTSRERVEGGGTPWRHGTGMDCIHREKAGLRPMAGRETVGERTQVVCGFLNRFAARTADCTQTDTACPKRRQLEWWSR